MITNEMVYALEKFRYENVSPKTLQLYLTVPMPPEDLSAEYTGDPEELKKYILFAAGCLHSYSPAHATPRMVEALRVLNQIPDADGSALFGIEE